MWATNEVLRFAAAAVVGLLAAVLLRGHRRDASALASVFLLVAAASHLTFPLLLRRGAATPILHAVLLLAIAAPLAFWLLAEVHFDDDFRLRPLHLGVAVDDHRHWIRGLVGDSRATHPGSPLGPRA